MYKVRMSTPKAMTIRLSPEQAEALELVANVDHMPVSDVIRAAIDQHVHDRKADPAFRDGLKDRIDRAKRFLSK